MGCSYQETFDQPWPTILTHYFDDQLDNIPYDTAFDMAVDDYFPEFAKQEDEENQAFADSLIEEQERSLARKEAREGKAPAPKQVSEKKEEISMSFDMPNPDEE